MGEFRVLGCCQFLKKGFDFFKLPDISLFEEKKLVVNDNLLFKIRKLFGIKNASSLEKCEKELSIKKVQ